MHSICGDDCPTELTEPVVRAGSAALAGEPLDAGYGVGDLIVTWM